MHWDNIQPGMEDQFAKYQVANIILKIKFKIKIWTTPGQGFTGSHSYDLGSIMHYSQHAFSANTLPTITPRHGGGEEGDMGQRRHLTQGDRDKVTVRA